jgi:hypothetical protein
VELPKVTELKKLIKFCRENGISELKHGEFEVKLSPAAHFPEPPQSQDTEKSIEETPLTEEEILMWSTGLIPMDEKESN